MIFNFENTDKPIFIQLAELLEDGILRGIFDEGTQIPSVAEISVEYNLNPATANKGVNLLVADGIVYKKRGIGMFVAEGAAEVIKQRRADAFYNAYVVPLCDEAQKIGMQYSEIEKLMEKYYLSKHK